MALFIENLSFSYDNKSVLTNLSMYLQPGEIGTLIGASGSGKTSLFKLLTGLLPVQKGYISIFGITPPKGCQNIAYMMQQDMLLPWRTVLANLLLVKELGIETRSGLEQEALNLLEEVGLKDCAYLYPDELSGGMRQRVSLARALFQKRPLLLLDEPFGALDVGLREQMYALLKKLKKKHHYTILMVTHDFRDALSLSDRLFLLSKGSIQKEWQIMASMRQDLVCMSSVQQELQLLITNPNLAN